MFSSNDLINFVFAYENDRCYEKSLIKLPLNQYLWTQLHPWYSRVYFLSGKTKPEVKTFGDKNAVPYQEEPHKKPIKLFGFQSGTDQLGAWMQKVLLTKSSEAGAIVCPLEDFCSLLKDPLHEKALAAIAADHRRTGTIVLTLSPVVDHAIPLLLESPVFEYLHEDAVLQIRKQNSCDLFRSLYDTKHNACYFLNILNAQRCENILCNLLMKQPKLFAADFDVETAAAYLSQAMVSPQLCQKDRVPDSFETNMTQSELYSVLNNKSCWDWLVQKTRCVRQAGGVKQYLRQNGIAEVTPDAVAIVRDPQSLAGKCLALRLPADADATREELLKQIQHRMSHPENHVENPQLFAAAKPFVDACRSAIKDGDDSTLWCALRSLDRCTQWLYAKPASQEETAVAALAEELRRCVELSSACFRSRKTLERDWKQFQGGKLAEAALRQNEQQLLVQERLLKQCMDVAFAKSIDLAQPGIDTESLDEIKQILQSMGDEEVSEMPPSEEEDSVPTKQELPSDQYSLDKLRGFMS